MVKYPIVLEFYGTLENKGSKNLVFSNWIGIYYQIYRYLSDRAVMITIFEKLYSDFTPIKLRIQVVKESLSEHGDGGGGHWIFKSVVIFSSRACLNTLV